MEAVVSLVGCLDRHCNQYDIPSLQNCAERSLVQAWIGSAGSQNVKRVHDRLKQIRGILTTPMTDKELQLLSEAKKTCETLCALQPTDSLRSHLVSVGNAFSLLLPTLAKTLEPLQSDKKQQAVIVPSMPITIRCSNNSTVEVPTDSHFISASVFLSNLHLQGGDVIKLDIPQTTLETVLEFCRMDEETPCPVIEPPLPAFGSRTLRRPILGFIRSHG